MHAHIICLHAYMPGADKHVRHAAPYVPVLLRMFVQLPEIMSLVTINPQLRRTDMRNLQIYL